MFPVDYLEKYLNPLTITSEQEKKILEDFESATNNIISRCNFKCSTSISPITLIKQTDYSIPLTAEDFDSNMTKLKSVFNQIIIAAEPYGFNPANPLDLILRSEIDRPLYIQDRDTNYSTIQIFLNSANSLFTWAGF